MIYTYMYMCTYIYTPTHVHAHTHIIHRDNLPLYIDVYNSSSLSASLQEHEQYINAIPLHALDAVI